MRLNKCLLTVVLALLSIRSWAGPTSIVTRIEGPNASFTDASGINNRGEIVGTFQDAEGLHGYVYRRGDLTPLDRGVPGASTIAFGINDRGQITGAYRSQGLFIGFLWDRGTFTDIRDRDNGRDVDETLLHMINNRGQIIGHSRKDVHSLARLFVWADGTFTYPTNIPGVLIVGRNRESLGLNDRGQIVGSFQSGGVTRGFLLDNGATEIIDFPGSRATLASGINNRGQIVGTYIDGFDVGHAYIRNTDRSYTQIEALNVEGIAGVRVNERFDLVGMLSSGGIFRGFVWSQSQELTASLPSVMNHVPR